MFVEGFDVLKWLAEQLTKRLRGEGQKAQQVATFLDTTAAAIEEAAAAFEKDELPWAAYGRLEEISRNFGRVLSQVRVIGPYAIDKKDTVVTYEEALGEALGIILQVDLPREDARRAIRLRHEWEKKDDVVQERLQRVAGRFRGLADTIRADSYPVPS